MYPLQPAPPRSSTNRTLPPRPSTSALCNSLRPLPRLLSACCFILTSPPIPTGPPRLRAPVRATHAVPISNNSSNRLGLGRVPRLLGGLCRFPIQLRQVVLFELLPVAPDDTHSADRLQHRVSHMYATGTSRKRLTWYISMSKTLSGEERLTLWFSWSMRPAVSSMIYNLWSVVWLRMDGRTANCSACC